MNSRGLSGTPPEPHSDLTGPQSPHPQTSPAYCSFQAQGAVWRVQGASTHQRHRLALWPVLTWSGRCPASTGARRVVWGRGPGPQDPTGSYVLLRILAVQTPSGPGKFGLLQRTRVSRDRLVSEHFQPRARAREAIIHELLRSCHGQHRGPGVDKDPQRV